MVRYTGVPAVQQLQQVQMAIPAHAAVFRFTQAACCMKGSPEAQLFVDNSIDVHSVVKHPLFKYNIMSESLPKGVPTNHIQQVPVFGFGDQLARAIRAHEWATLSETKWLWNDTKHDMFCDPLGRVLAFTALQKVKRALKVPELYLDVFERYTKAAAPSEGTAESPGRPSTADVTESESPSSEQDEDEEEEEAWDETPETSVTPSGTVDLLDITPTASDRTDSFEFGGGLVKVTRGRAVELGRSPAAGPSAPRVTPGRSSHEGSVLKRPRPSDFDQFELSDTSELWFPVANFFPLDANGQALKDAWAAGDKSRIPNPDLDNPASLLLFKSVSWAEFGGAGGMMDQLMAVLGRDKVQVYEEFSELVDRVIAHCHREWNMTDEQADQVPDGSKGTKAKWAHHIKFLREVYHKVRWLAGELICQEMQQSRQQQQQQQLVVAPRRATIIEGITKSDVTIVGFAAMRAEGIALIHNQDSSLAEEYTTRLSATFDLFRPRSLVVPVQAPAPVFHIPVEDLHRVHDMVVDDARFFCRNGWTGADLRAYVWTFGRLFSKVVGARTAEQIVPRLRMQADNLHLEPFLAGLNIGHPFLPGTMADP